MDVVEPAGLRIHVVFCVVAIQFLPADEVLEVDVAACLGIAGIRVVIQLVGAQQHVGSFEMNAAPQMPHHPVRLLRDGLNMDMFGVRRTGTNCPDLLIGVGAGLRLRNGRR